MKTLPIAAAVLAILAFALDASATSQVSDEKTTTIHYEAGDATQDGYEVARITVRYRFKECFGTVDLLYKLDSESLSVHRYYWYRGERHDVQGVDVPTVRSVEFEGRVTGRGPNQTFSTTADTRGTGCMDTDVKLGKFSEYWAKGADDEERLAALKTLDVVTASAGFTAPPLRNPAAERFITNKLKQAEDEKKEQERLAAEEARKQEEAARAAAEAERKAQEEAERARAEAEAQAQAEHEAEEDESDSDDSSMSDEEAAAYAQARREDAEHERRMEEIRSENTRAAVAQQLEQEQADRETIDRGVEATGRIVEGVTDFIDMANAAVPNWLDLELALRLVTDFETTTTMSPSLVVRGGGVFYLYFGAGTFGLPAVAKNLERISLIDGKGATNTYLELGTGLGVPAGQFIVRPFEIAIGPTFVSIPETPGFVDEQTSVVFGFSLGAGLSYRLPNTGLAFGFTIRMQPMNYLEELEGPASATITKASLFALSLGLSTIWRFDT